MYATTLARNLDEVNQFTIKELLLFDDAKVQLPLTSRSGENLELHTLRPGHRLIGLTVL